MSLASVFDTFETGVYVVTRTVTSALVDGEPVATPAWITATHYDVGDLVTSDGNTYACAAAGTSSAAPTGDTSPVIDGSLQWTFLTVNSLSVEASVQPMSGRKLADLPEAQHADDVRNLYTMTRLFTREPGFEPDVVTYKGETWRVTQVETWEMDDETHYECQIERTAVP